MTYDSYKELIKNVENGNLELRADMLSLNPEDVLVVDEREICYGNLIKYMELLDYFKKNYSLK